jgi:hypothetical protein
MRQFNFVSLDILYTCSSAVDINLDIEIAYFILFFTFVDILYAEVRAKYIIHAHICLLPCNVNALAVQNSQNGRMNLQFHSDILQHRQAKPNVEAHARGSLLLVEYTQVCLLLLYFKMHFAEPIITDRIA